MKLLQMKKYFLLLIFITTGFSTFAGLPDSIKNGSDFYIFYMDNTSQKALGSKVKVPKMIRDYDIWPEGSSLSGNTPVDAGAWGEPVDNNDSYTAFKVDNWEEEWNGGAIVAILKEFDELPNLKPVTDNADDYYFHFAIKSPSDQPNAGLVLFLYSDGTPTNTAGNGGLKYFIGPADTGNNLLPSGTKRLSDYAHNGQWQHFEIPVSQLKNAEYRWDEPLHVWNGASEGKIYLLGFQSIPHVPGNEINLDAMFFYKKPAATTGGINMPAIESNSLSVYPNPAGNTLHIKGNGSNVSARIHDLTGKTVLSRVLSESEIDVSELSRGVYFLKINNQTVKFIKE